SRMIASGSNTYTGVTTVTSGFYRITNNSALGVANAAEGLGTIVQQAAVLELQNVALTGEHLQLQTSNFQPGLYDTPGLFTVAQPSGVNNMYGTGELRVIGG